MIKTIRDNDGNALAIVEVASDKWVTVNFDYFSPFKGEVLSILPDGSVNEYTAGDKQAKKDYFDLVIKPELELD